MYKREGVTELLHCGGLGKVLPSGGAVGLAFEATRAHQAKGGQAEEGRRPARAQVCRHPQDPCTD